MQTYSKPIDYTREEKYFNSKEPYYSTYFHSEYDRNKDDIQNDKP